MWSCKCSWRTVRPFPQGRAPGLERLSSSSAPADACKRKPYIELLSCSWRS